MTNPLPDNGWLGILLGLAKREYHQRQGEERRHALMFVGGLMCAMGVATLVRATKMQSRGR